ncbi:MAG: hypothetical protein IT320_00135 [Anaerolineae bacterium]|nr:hypothetical protein [Anaerolineae bacterium]
MNRLTIVFLVLLGLATLLLGQVWSGGEIMLNGQGTPADTTTVVLSAVLLVPVFVVLGRMVYLNARLTKAAARHEHEEM